MDLKEFNDAVGRILGIRGIKGKVEFAEVRKDIQSGLFQVRLIICPTKDTIQKLLDLAFKEAKENGNTNKRKGL